MRMPPLNRRTLVTIALAGIAAGCVGTGGRSSADTFGHMVPSPARAVYHIADTMVVDLSSPPGSLEAVSASTFTMGLDFATDPGGVRVTGTVESLEATMDSPMTPTETAGLDDVSGTLGFLMGPYAVAEVTSFPEVGAPSPMLSFPSLPYLLFPRLVPGLVLPGATWADTATTSYEGEVGVTFSTVTDYTLVGDTAVDGRSLMHIAVAAQVTIGLEADGEILSNQSLEGSSNGFLLWDPERKLVAYGWFDRDMAGDMTIPGMPTIPLGITGSTVLRLGG